MPGKKETLADVAADLNQFWFDYDTYEYRDNYGSMGEGLDAAIDALKLYPEQSIQVLQEAIDVMNEVPAKARDADLKANIKQAKRLISRIKALQDDGRPPARMPAKPAPPKPEYYDLSDSPEMDELAADLAKFMSVADADGFEQYYDGDMGTAIFEARCAIEGTPDQVIETLDSFGGDARARDLAARVRDIATRMGTLKASQSRKAKKIPSKSKASQSKKTSRSCSNAKKAKAPAKKTASKAPKRRSR